MTLDGRLDEAAWARRRRSARSPRASPRRAPRRGGDRGARPARRAPPLLRHPLLRPRARGHRGHEDGPRRRDRGDDHVMVVLDTFADRRNGFFFAVNPRGARAEGQIANNSESLNFDWDGIWDAAARVDGEGWTAELAIPFKTLRFKTGLAPGGSTSSATSRGGRRPTAGRPRGGTSGSRTSPRRGASRASTARGRAGASTSGRTSPGEADRRDGSGKIGGDVFKNVTPNLTASLTVNTDFAETEADDRQVNLTRFPLFSRKSAPSSSRGPGSTRRPVSAATTPTSCRSTAGASVSPGQEVPILAGLKASGRVDRWNVGLLDVETGRETSLASNARTCSPPASAATSSGSRSSGASSPTVIRPAPGQHPGRRRCAPRHVHLPGRGEPEPRPLRVRHGRRGVGPEGLRLGRQARLPERPVGRGPQVKEIGDDFRPALGFVGRTGIRKTNAKADFMPRPAGRDPAASSRPRPSTSRTLAGRTLDWMVIASPLGFETESGEEPEARVGPAVRAARRAVRDPAWDRDPSRRLSLHGVDRGGGDGPAPAVGGEVERAGGASSTGTSPESSPRSRSSRAPTPRRRRRRVEPGRAARREVHGEGPGRAASR